MATDCTFHNEYELGPLNIDYARLYYCEMHGYEFFSILFLICWVAFLTNLLGNTAGNYFSPTLASICLRLNLSHDIAGVTFLAFGNGAPDVFASITSFSGSADVMIGIGSLLGGSVFVTTIVVGSIAILNPCEVTPRSFYRDVGFHLIAASVLATIAYLGEVNLFLALFLFFIYGIYAIVVSVSSMMEEHTLGEQEKRILSTATTQVQTAFWHKSAVKSPSHQSRHLDKGNKSRGTSFPFPINGGYAAGATSSTTNSVSEYKFLILDESLELKPGEAQNEDGEINLSGAIISPEFDAEIIEDYFSASTKIGIVSGDSNDVDMGRIIDRPMGYHHPHQQHQNASSSGFSTGVNTGSDSSRMLSRLSKPISPISGRGFPPNYGVKKRSPTSKSAPYLWTGKKTGGGSNSKSTSPVYGFMEEGGAIELNSLTHSLIDDDGDGDYDDSNITEESTLTTSALDQQPSGRSGMNYDVQDNEIDLIADREQYHSAIYSLYWQQYLLRRRLQRCLVSAEWWNYPWGYKLLAIIEYPVVLARDITIPTVDEDLWWKPYAVIQPIAATLFVIIISGNSTSTLWGIPHLPIPLVGAFVSLFPASFVFFITHYSHPPTNRMFGSIWVLFAFVMCSAWVYLLAGELVACLTAVGVVFRIPPIYLGLTVLAWGNSIGDFFSNLSVASKGLGQMAIAGCYGGPVFNILVGLGLALTYACYLHYPTPFKLTFNISSVVSLVFLYCILLTTLTVVTLRGFKVERWFGFVLLSIYAVHTAVQGTLLFTGTK